MAPEDFREFPGHLRSVSERHFKRLKKRFIGISGGVRCYQGLLMAFQEISEVPGGLRSPIGTAVKAWIFSITLLRVTY